MNSGTAFATRLVDNFVLLTLLALSGWAGWRLLRAGWWLLREVIDHLWNAPPQEGVPLRRFAFWQALFLFVVYLLFDRVLVGGTKMTAHLVSKYQLFEPTPLQSLLLLQPDYSCTFFFLALALGLALLACRQNLPFYRVLICESAALILVWFWSFQVALAQFWAIDGKVG